MTHEALEKQDYQIAAAATARGEGATLGDLLSGLGYAGGMAASVAVPGDLGDLADAALAADDVPQVLANQAAGNAARDAIAARYASSQTEVTFETALGARRVDVLTQEGLAIESKVGYTSLTSGVQSQIAKDQLLMQNGDVSGVQWEFSPSAVTGRVGPSGPLAAALEKAGIPWVIGP